MLNTSKSVRTAGFMMAAVFTAKISGMLRDIIIASIYGTSAEAAAYSSASLILVYFFDIGITAAVSSVFIPVFNEYLEKGEKQKAHEFSNTFLNIVLITSVIITFFGMLAARPIVSLIAGGLIHDTYILAVQLVRILFPMLIFAGTAFTFVAILQSYDEFTIPSIISLASNLIIIIYLIFWNKHFGIYGLAVATVVGWVAQAFVQVPSLIKKGYRYRPIINLKNTGIKKAGILVLPFLISTWVQPINALVNIHLASWLNEGRAVVALDYAHRVYLIIVGVFTYTLSNLIFPSLSRTNTSTNKEQFTALIRNSLNTVLYFVTPLMTGFIILRRPIIKLIYERGAFDSFSTELTSKALLYLSIGMVGFAVKEIMNKAYFATQDARTPMKVSVLGILVNIALSIILSKTMGLAGIALASSIASILIAVLLVFFMQRRYGGIFDKKNLWNYSKTLTASLVMGIIVYFLHSYFTKNIITSTILVKLLAVAIPGLTGIAVYIPLTLLMGLDMARLPFKIFKKDP